MKDLETLLADLGAAGVKLWVDGDKLKLRAPQRALTPDLTDALRERKAEILALLGGGLGGAIPKVPMAQSYAPSAAQRRLWVLAQFPDASVAYNIPLHQFLDGPLDADALAEASVRLVRRHESLRTTFPVVEGEPRQVVQGDWSWSGPLERRDLSAQPDPEGTARRLGREEAGRPFDLSAGPLLRAILLKLAPRRHVLLLTMHHIVADGVSLGILARDLSRLYESARLGVPEDLPPLRIAYRDYAAWQAGQLECEAMALHRRFWLDRLGGELPMLDLPTDFPRPPVQTFTGGELSFTLARPQLDALEAFCRARNASLFMALHAIVKALLFAYTGQEDIVVGCPIAGRDHHDLSDQVGFYLNTLALRTRIRAESSFETFFADVAAETKAAFDHRVYPFDRLLGELSLARDPSRFPLFDVVLVLQSQDEPGLGLVGLSASPVFDHPQTSKFDLTITAKATPAGLILAIEYNTDLFREARIRRMGGHLLTLIEAVLADPTQPVNRLNPLPEEERRLVTALGEPAHAPWPAGTLVERFERQAARTPQHIALVSPGGQGTDGALPAARESLTYAELSARANRLAHYLRRRGALPGLAVGLLMDRSLDLVVAILAILKSGASYLPLDPTHPPERTGFALADAGAPLLVTHSHLARRLPETAATLVLFDMDAASIAAASAADPPSLVRPGDRAYIIYTSGSTGQPKGVPVTHANATRLFDATEERFRFGPDDVWTLFHSCAFDFSVWELWGALLYGGRLVVPSHWTTRSPEGFHALLRQEGVTVLNQTPSAFHQLAQWEQQTDAPALPALRWVVFGGEALDFASLARWLARHGDREPRLANMYGITETTVHVTFRGISADDVRERASLIGRPLPDLCVRLLDPRLRPVPIGIAGEICVGGPGVVAGYLNRPDLTAARFVSDPADGTRLYRSGDLGRYREDGDIEYLGRLDSQVQIRGYRVELGEIESVLAALAGVRQAVVEARAEAEGGARLVAWYVGTEACDLSPAQLRGALAARLPDYMVPTSFVRVAEIPLTANGKVDRRALAEPEGETVAASPYDPPRTDWERRLSRLWEEVLRVPRVGRHDNFFDLGGHSLKAAAFVAALHKDYGMRFGLADVFRKPTVAALARLAEELESGRGGAVEPIARVEPEAPTAAASIAPATAEELEWLNR